MTQSTPEQQAQRLREALHLLDVAAQYAPDQLYGVVGYDPHTGHHQAAGPFPNTAAAQAYADLLSGQVNDAHAAAEGLPLVTFTVCHFFTPET